MRTEVLSKSELAARRNIPIGTDDDAELKREKAASA